MEHIEEKIREILDKHFFEEEGLLPSKKMVEELSTFFVTFRVPKDTEELILSSQIFVLEKLRDDLLKTPDIKKSDSGDADIDNYKVRVGNVLFVFNSMVERLKKQRESLSTSSSESDLVSPK